MAGSVLAGMASGMAQSAFDSSVQYFNQKHLNAQAQHDYRENLKLSAELNKKAQFDAVAQSTSALRAAGLSPALAANGNYSAPAASAPLASSSAGMPHSEGASMIQAINDARAFDNQQELVKAETRKLKADADKTEIENKHTRSEDSSLSEGLYQMIDEMRNSTDNPFMRGFLDNFLSQSENKIDLGVYNAFNKLWYDMSQKQRDQELDYISKEFDKKVMSMQFDNGAAAALADMPRAKRFEVYKNIQFMNAQIAKLNADTSLTEDVRSQIKANVSKMAQETLALFHSDPAAMYKAGDISSLLVGLGFDVTKEISHGFGMASGYALAGSLVPGAGVKGVVTQATSKAAPIASKAASKAVPDKVLGDIRASINRNFPSATPQYKAALFNKSVERYRKVNGMK